MRRRGYLVAAGTVATGGLAGCSLLGGGASDGTAGDAPYEHPGTIDETFATNGEFPQDDDPSDGIPPEFPDAPADPDADASAYATLEASGETIRLVPIDVADAWYRNADARFVDARGQGQYQHAHVYGSVLSTAQRDSTGGGIDGWSTDDRIVTYCGCPHHLSSLRAAGFQKAGYSNVYAIDEGFGEWFDRSYPMAGTSFRPDTQSDVSEWELTGKVDSTHAGEYAWAQTDGQYEAAPIRDDGSFTLTLAFAGVTDETPVQVSTPAFTVSRPLGELIEEEISGP